MVMMMGSLWNHIVLLCIIVGNIIWNYIRDNPILLVILYD